MAFTVKAVVELALVLSIVLIIIISHGAKAIELGSSLSATTTNKNSSAQYWLSPSGIFAFGFRQQSNNTNGFDICIWMLSQPHPTVVWTARKGEAGEPYSRKATANLTKDGLLVHDNRLIRRLIAVNSDDDNDDEPYYQLSYNITSGAILDSGNFVLYGETTGNVVWQSFKYPTDTLLGGQNLTTSGELGSSGRSGFRLLMRSIGELVLYTSNDYISREENSYWVLNTSRSGNPELCLSTSGSLYVLSQDGGYYRRNQNTRPCSKGAPCYSKGDPTNPGNGGASSRTNIPTCQGGAYGRACSSYYSYTQQEPYFLARARDENGSATASFVYRATLDTDGIFRLYSHRFSRGGNSSGVMRWSALQNKCEVKGFCGLNSYCAAEDGDGSEYECRCYPGFDFINVSDKNPGCYRSFTGQSCISGGEEGGLPKELRVPYDISTIQNMEWHGYSYLLNRGQNKEWCERACQDDCDCWAALYMNNTECRKYSLPLPYGKRNKNLSTIALFKVVSNDHWPKHFKIPVDEKNDLIVILASSLGSVLFLFFLLAVASFVLYRRRVDGYKRLPDNSNLGLDEDFSLLQFSYKELESATNNFSEELGKGSSGAVYKGTTAGKRDVAVKKLERDVEEGVREFQAEIKTVGQTHHKNLVQLVGFCVDGSERLLVYEFMKNGSLSDLLFKADQRPAWENRAKFALDVARGLFYLHEECGVRIIHCNLNPQNILLDENLTAKISDFGFARLIVPDQAKLILGDEESKGYLAPEWQNNAAITAKTDIYSFGTVLFGIVSCKRSIDVKKCNKFEDVMKLVELDDCSNVDKEAIERMVKVGLLCVQDHPESRPTMTNVILMLEGTMDIPNPELPNRE